jgi:hypothetical protein
LIAQATGYTVHAVRRVADDLAAADLIDPIEKKPVQYRTSVEKWRERLDLADEPPVWRYWFQGFSFACQILEVGSQAHWSDLSPYLRSTRLRDLVERYQEGLHLARIDLPDPGRYRGEEYNAAFAGLVSDLTDWIRKVV